MPTGSDVAIKFIGAELLGSPLALARFQREARAAARIRSPHVVTLHDSGVEAGTPYIVMELLDGEDLKTMLEREGRFEPERAAWVIGQAAKGLQAAHAAGVCTRPHPAKVFVAFERGRAVKLLLRIAKW